MSNQWRGQAVHQTCPYHSPGWKTSSTQTLALSIFFLYNPQCCCCCYVCHSSIKGPWHPVPCSTFLYEPAGSSMPRPSNPPPLPTMPFINRWWKWWWKRCYKDRGAPVLCLSIKQNSLFYCYIAIFWQYHGLGTISIGSPLPCECFQRWHWQNSLMILSLTPSLPPSYSQCWWWKTQNLSRDSIDRNIDRTSIYKHIYLSIYLPLVYVCMRLGHGLRGLILVLHLAEMGRWTLLLLLTDWLGSRPHPTTHLHHCHLRPETKITKLWFQSLQKLRNCPISISRLKIQ